MYIKDLQNFLPGKILHELRFTLHEPRLICKTIPISHNTQYSRKYSILNDLRKSPPGHESRFMPNGSRVTSHERRETIPPPLRKEKYPFLTLLGPLTETI